MPLTGEGREHVGHGHNILFQASFTLFILVLLFMWISPWPFIEAERPSSTRAPPPCGHLLMQRVCRPLIE